MILLVRLVVPLPHVDEQGDHSVQSSISQGTVKVLYTNNYRLEFSGILFKKLPCKLELFFLFLAKNRNLHTINWFWTRGSIVATVSRH